MFTGGILIRPRCFREGRKREINNKHDEEEKSIRFPKQRCMLETPVNIRRLLGGEKKKRRKRGVLSSPPLNTKERGEGRRLSEFFPKAGCEHDPKGEGKESANYDLKKKKGEGQTYGRTIFGESLRLSRRSELLRRR